MTKILHLFAPIVLGILVLFKVFFFFVQNRACNYFELAGRALSILAAAALAPRGVIPLTYLL